MFDFKKLILPSESKLTDALVILDKYAEAQIVLIIDMNNKLLGTVTDGDVRRGLLAGLTLESSVEGVMCTNFKSISSEIKKQNIKNSFTENGVKQLPELDDQGRVVGFHLMDEQQLIESSKANVIIMAGGLGSRLSPLTDDCPKPMLKVGGTPILQIIIERLARQGFRNIYISINYLGNQIQDYFGNGSKFGVDITYIQENDKLGTAGALGLLPQGLETPMIVLNGDVLTKANYASLLDYHLNHQSNITIGLTKQELTIPYGVVNLEQEKVISIDEKPTQSYYVSAGIYCVSPSIFETLSGSEYLDMPDLIQKNIDDQNNVIGFPLHEYWADIGMKSDYNKANESFQKNFNK